MITLKQRLKNLERKIGVITEPITIVVQQSVGRLPKPHSSVIKDGEGLLTVKYAKPNWPKARKTKKRVPETEEKPVRPWRTVPEKEQPPEAKKRPVYKSFVVGGEAYVVHHTDPLYDASPGRRVKAIERRRGPLEYPSRTLA